MKSLRVLIVEDEALIAFLIEDAVEAGGHKVAETVTNITDAVKAVSLNHFDVALLDLNLNGQKGHVLPVMLASRKKPFAFVTGYGEEGVLQKFSDAPLVEKPFRTETILEVLGKLECQLAT